MCPRREVRELARFPVNNKECLLNQKWENVSFPVDEMLRVLDGKVLVCVHLLEWDVPETGGEGTLFGSSVDEMGRVLDQRGGDLSGFQQRGLLLWFQCFCSRLVFCAAHSVGF